MRRPAPSRILTVALLLVVLTVPIAWAKGPSSSRASGAASTFSLAELVSRAWESLVSLWMDNGCGADPSGRCLVAPATDNGCGADPDGRCLSRR